MVPRPWSGSPGPGECLHSLLSERLWICRDISAQRRSAPGSPRPSDCQQLSFLPGNQPTFLCLQALAALVPGVTQVDNKSGFLQKRPHRQHPGILKLPHVRLPQALANGAQLLLLGSAGPTMENQVQTLTSYLWSRHLPVEPEELQRRARHLEKKFLENPDLSQTEEKLRGAVLHALRKTTYHWQEL
ncbi:methyltransferase like 17, partial [Homo sapiens]